MRPAVQLFVALKDQAAKQQNTGQSDRQIQKTVGQMNQNKRLSGQTGLKQKTVQQIVRDYFG